MAEVDKLRQAKLDLESKLERVRGAIQSQSPDSSETQNEVLGRLCQISAAHLLGISERTMRRADAPRNDDDTYSGPEIVAWHVGRQAETAAPVATSLREQKTEEEIRKLQRSIKILDHTIGEHSRTHVPLNEIREACAIVSQVMRDGCRQAEKQFGTEGRELFESVLDAMLLNYRRLIGQVDGEILFCVRSGKQKRLKVVGIK